MVQLNLGARLDCTGMVQLEFERPVGLHRYGSAGIWAPGWTAQVWFSCVLEPVWTAQVWFS